MKICLLLFLMLVTGSCMAQPDDEAAIRGLLARQIEAWNRGNIDEFMETYWKNDSLMFIGKSGVTYGWTNTLNNYKRNYPDARTMGKLSFNILMVKPLSQRYYQVVGKWHLKRSVGDLDGHYTLLMEKIDGKWVIIADHSS